MKQITLKVKDSYYTMLVQFLKTLAFVEIVEMEELSDAHFDSENSEVEKLYSSWKSMETSDGINVTQVNVAEADRNYTFNREELNDR